MKEGVLVSRFRGPCFKKIQQLGALMESTSKRHKSKAILETNHIPVKSLNIVFV